MNWLLLLFYIELGAVTQNDWVMYEASDSVHSTPAYFLDTGVRAEMFDCLFIDGGIKTRSYQNTGRLSFSPFTDEYSVGVGFWFENVEIGFRHLCTHPVIPYIKMDRPVIQYEGGYEEIYIRYEMRRN